MSRRKTSTKCSIRRGQAGKEGQHGKIEALRADKFEECKASIAVK
jgi:hypothetical protein